MVHSVNNLLKYYSGCNLCEEIEPSVDRVKFSWDFFQLFQLTWLAYHHIRYLKVLLWARTGRRSGEQNTVKSSCNLSIWGISKNFKHVKTTSFIAGWRYNWKFPWRLIEIKPNSSLNLSTASLSVRFSRIVHFWKHICLNV